jgi:hypothetical protein
MKTTRHLVVDNVDEFWRSIRLHGTNRVIGYPVKYDETAKDSMLNPALPATISHLSR